MRCTELLLSIAIVLCGTAARADTVVQIAGQTPGQIKAAVTAAAEKVCTDAMIKHQLDDASSEDECVADTVDAAMQRIKDGEMPQIAAAGAH